jgi:hypothetical protein
LRTESVDTVSKIGIAGTALDVGVSGCMDDQVGSGILHCVADRLPVRDIYLGQVDTSKFVISKDIA